MSIQIVFWKEVNSNGHIGHAGIWAYSMPGEKNVRDETIEEAKRAFCERFRLSRWDMGANGFDIKNGDRRKNNPRRHIEERRH